MYERMLNKAVEPTYAEMLAFCKDRGALFDGLNSYLKSTYNTATEINFPYGNHYGWGVKHNLGKAHICYIFAEDNALNVMLRLDDAQFFSVSDKLLPYTREFIDNRYPCGKGGVIHYRVLEAAHLADIKTLLDVKMQKKKVNK